MKKILFILLLTVNAMFGQMAKNIGSFKFDSGLEVKEGMTIELVSGAHPVDAGDYVWIFQGGSMPVPKKHCDKSFNGKQFIVKKVLSLKYVEKNESIIVMFESDGLNYYSFVSQAISMGEAKFY